MAKTHAYSGFNGWHILSSLVLFVDSWYSKVIEIKLIKWAPSSEFVSSSIPSWQISTAHAQPFRGARDLAFCLKVPLDSLLVWATFAARIGDKYQISLTRPNYFSLVSQNSKLERNEAFPAEIILYFIRNKGNYLAFLEFSQFRRRSILQQKEIYEAYTFHIIYKIQCMKHKNNVPLQIFDSLCIKTQKTMENIIFIDCHVVSRLPWKAFSIAECLNPCPFQIDVTLLLYNRAYSKATD